MCSDAIYRYACEFGRGAFLLKEQVHLYFYLLIGCLHPKKKSATRPCRPLKFEGALCLSHVKDTYYDCPSR